MRVLIVDHKGKDGIDHDDADCINHDGQSIGGENSVDHDDAYSHADTEDTIDWINHNDKDIDWINHGSVDWCQS